MAKKSLPSRKCGLKSKMRRSFTCVGQSLPSRKCGLKSLKQVNDGANRSHFPRGSVD